MPTFSLTQAALDDLAGMFTYGLESFGEAIAIKHLRDVKAKFALLAQFPEMGQQREDLFYLVPDI
jgi:plasmid stabilization system protein ParE